MRLLIPIFLAFLLFALPVAAMAGVAGNCGTVIIPPGLAEGPGADVTSFNPLLITSVYNQEASNLLFEPLLWINRFHEIDWSRSIARSVTVQDNGQVYQIQLRHWLWSDGVPVTAADVVYTFGLIKAYGTAYTGYGAGGMPDLFKSVVADDATHLTVTLIKPVNPEWFELNGLSQLIPLPEHVWGKFTPDEIWQGQSRPGFFRVVDGPLKIAKLVSGVDAQFVPNPNYGGAPMHFSRFIMKFEDSEGQELQAVQSRDLDASNIPFDLYDHASRLPGDRVVVMPPSFSWEELVPNLANPATRFFADVRVRQAMADAINQKEMIALAMAGHGESVRGPVPPVPPVFLSPAAKAGQSPVGYNPAKAQALLRAAGFAPGPDGILQKDGVRFSFTLLIPAGQPLRIEMAEAMQQNFRAVGIEMRARQVEFNEILTEMVNEPDNWQAILIGEDLSAYPTGEGLFKTGAFYNNNGYSSAKMDQLITQSTDAPGRDGLYAYEDYATAQQPVIFLPNPQYSLLVRKDLWGLRDFINPLGDWAPEKLYCTGQG
ncbi:MAG: peptide ABC transporter substrate-binding protein [Acidocella sp.]|nr:peptide ABC transporter substrate-binding protein [Acidocella sp.]